jgi:hypothetical protein
MYGVGSGATKSIICFKTKRAVRGHLANLVELLYLKMDRFREKKKRPYVVLNLATCYSTLATFYSMIDYR